MMSIVTETEYGIYLLGLTLCGLLAVVAWAYLSIKKK